MSSSIFLQKFIQKNLREGERIMSETNVTTKSKKFHHLNEEGEEKLKFCLKWKFPKLARQIGISHSTLYEEIKRGTITQMKSDLTYCQKYFSDVGQKIIEKILVSLSKFYKLKILWISLKKKFWKMVAGFSLRLCNSSQTVW